MSLVPAVPAARWGSFALIRLNAFSFGVSGFLLAMDTVVLPVLVLAVAPDNFKNSYLALLGLSGLLVAAVTQPLVGRLSDRTRSPLGRRAPYLIWGIFWVCACLAGVRMAPDFWTLFGVWVFVQINLNIANGPGQALIRDLVPPERINAASSIKILLDAAGGVTLIFIAGTLIGLEAAPGVVDWRWLTLALLGVGLLAAGTVTCQTVLSRQPPPAASAADEPPQPARQRLNLEFSLFLLSRLLLMAAVFIFPTYGLYFVMDVVEVEQPAQVVAWMILAIGGALVLAAWLSGRVFDRLGRKPVALAGAVGAALATAALLAANGALAVVLTASVIGAAVGMLLSANWAMANELSDRQNAGLLMGIVNLATIGGAAAARTLGPFIDWLNRFSEDRGYYGLIALCAALFLLGALALLPVKAGQRRPAEGGTTAAGGEPPGGRG